MVFLIASLSFVELEFTEAIKSGAKMRMREFPIVYSYRFERFIRPAVQVWTCDSLIKCGCLYKLTGEMASHGLRRAKW